MKQLYVKVVKQVAADTAYLCTAFPIALAAFAVGVAAFAAGVGTVAVWVGVPILAATLYAVRGLSAAARGRLAALLRRPVARPRYKRAPGDAGRMRRFLAPLTDPRSWKDLVWAAVQFPVALFGFVAGVTWWAVTLAVTLYPLYGWLIRRHVETDGMEYATTWLGWGDAYSDATTLAGIGSFVFSMLQPVVLRGLAKMQSAVDAALLTSPADEVRPPVVGDAVARARQRLAV
ncbi:Putative sensor [Glycomyces sambucus]|uniref:Putative sensor n=1 Tax=Glycomyces sambucus TaxID=380244 RepID=A0A1G9I8H0_9ACTN|nr:sensor domain-containing protein [Glycomyces sambucus]SDL21529.1 Putative sensor [Glycomyces sambucus]